MDDTRTTTDEPVPLLCFRRILALSWRIVSSPVWLIGWAGARVWEALSVPALSQHMPPPIMIAPAGSWLVADGNITPPMRGERLLLDIWRVSPAYREAVIMAARAALETPWERYLHYRVHFVLSRLVPDNAGSVPIARLRLALPDVPATLLNQALHDLESWEDVCLLPCEPLDDARAVTLGISDVVRGSLGRVQLMRLP